MAKVCAMNRGDCGRDWQFCKLIHDSKHIVIASHLFSPFLFKRNVKSDPQHRKERDQYVPDSLF